MIKKVVRFNIQHDPEYMNSWLQLPMKITHLTVHMSSLLGRYTVVDKVQVKTRGHCGAGCRHSYWYVFPAFGHWGVFMKRRRTDRALLHPLTDGGWDTLEVLEILYMSERRNNDARSVPLVGEQIWKQINLTWINWSFRGKSLTLKRASTYK